MRKKISGTMLAACLTLASTATAWEFTPGTPCVLTHSTELVDIELTYEPILPLYTLTVTRPSGLAPAPVFSIRFDGPMPIQISTDRHKFNPSNTILTVADSGFGNVLNGLQFNTTASIRLGPQKIVLDLTGARDPVDDFRRCDVVPSA